MNKFIWKKIELVRAYKKVFESVEGKLIMADLVRECGVLKNSFRGNHDEFLINEGKRNVALYILSNTNVDLKAILDMVEKQQGEIDG